MAFSSPSALWSRSFMNFDIFLRINHDTAYLRTPVFDKCDMHFGKLMPLLGVKDF